MGRLRSPKGCPWDREQDHETLKPFLLEETYEVYDALEDGSTLRLAEELGDLLLQIVLHAQYAAEEGVFDLADVQRSITEKIIRRHPHVFGDATAEDAEAVKTSWAKIKAAAQKVLDGEADKRTAIEAALASTDTLAAGQAKLNLALLDKAVQKANDDLAKFAGQETSFLGLEKPMFQLKNPGIISIPLGFLAVLLGSLLFRDRRSEALWPEVYARQNTGILASKATSH